jgi:hypothetical protein
MREIRPSGLGSGRGKRSRQATAPLLDFIAVLLLRARLTGAKGKTGGRHWRGLQCHTTERRKADAERNGCATRR